MNFVQLNNDVLFNKELTSNDKIVFATLLSYKNKDNGLCCPSLNLIAEDLKLSVPTVSKCIKRLEELSYIQVKREKQSKFSGHVNNSYKFIKGVVQKIKDTISSSEPKSELILLLEEHFENVSSKIAKSINELSPSKDDLLYAIEIAKNKNKNANYIVGILNNMKTSNKGKLDGTEVKELQEDFNEEVKTLLESNSIQINNKNKIELIQCIKDGLETSLIQKAIEVSLNKNQNSLGYVLGILKNWIKDGIHSAELLLSNKFENNNHQSPKYSIEEIKSITYNTNIDDISMDEVDAILN